MPTFGDFTDKPAPRYIPHNETAADETLRLMREQTAHLADIRKNIAVIEFIIVAAVILSIVIGFLR